jgi:PilZ domain-containing protein
MIGENNSGINVSSDPGLPERRKHPRYPFTATIEMVEPLSHTRIQGRTNDLSRGGCYADATSSFPAGSIVNVHITKETRSFEARAEVAYSIDGMGMGVKFTDADPEQFSTLEKWLAELKGEMLPEPTVPQPSDASFVQQQRPGNEEYFVLNELVIELMRQGVLSNIKCEAMLQKLNRNGHAKAIQAMPESRLTGLMPF